MKSGVLRGRLVKENTVLFSSDVAAPSACNEGGTALSFKRRKSKGFIPEDRWHWCGYAGHLIVSDRCRFRMHTRVGNWRISTVGDYRPGPIPGMWEGSEMEAIGGGPDAFFETYVFPVAGHGVNGEGEVTDWFETDGERYATAIEAERGHMRYCYKYAGRTEAEPRPEA